MSLKTFPNSSETLVCSISFHSLTKKEISTLYGITTFTSILNSLASPSAVSLNLLVVIAIAKTRSLWYPSNLLLCFLAITDLLNGLTVQPFLVIFNVSRIQGDKELFCLASAGFSYPFGVLFTISFLTLTLVNVDRFVAIKYPLHYELLVTNKRVYIAAITCWLVCSSDLLLKMNKLYQAHFIFFFFVLLLGISITSASYYSIFHVMKKHKLQMEREEKLTVYYQKNNKNKNIELDLKERKKAKIMAYLNLLFLICYLPYIPVSIANAVHQGKQFPLQLKIAGNVTVTLVLLNGALNPLFYCYRLRSIRKAVFIMLRMRYTSIGVENGIGPSTAYHG